MGVCSCTHLGLGLSMSMQGLRGGGLRGLPEKLGSWLDVLFLSGHVWAGWPPQHCNFIPQWNFGSLESVSQLLCNREEKTEAHRITHLGLHRSGYPS